MTPSSSTNPVAIHTDRRPSASSTHSAPPFHPSALLSPDDHSSHPRGKHGSSNNSNSIGSSNGNNSGSVKDRDTASDSHSFRSFFRSSSRPPSPTPLSDPNDPLTLRAIPPLNNTTYNNSSSTSTMANSFSALSSSNATLHSNAPSAYFQTTAASNHGSGYHQRPAPHPFSPSSSRRLSADTSSRSPSPDVYQQHPPLPGGKHLFPTTPPAPRGPHQPHQRADSIRSASETPHRRTKSTDFGDMYSKRPGLPQDLVADIHTTVASPAKEAKKTLFSLFKKKSHHPSSSPTPPPSSNYPPSEGTVFILCFLCSNGC